MTKIRERIRAFRNGSFAADGLIRNGLKKLKILDSLEEKGGKGQ